MHGKSKEIKKKYNYFLNLFSSNLAIIGSHLTSFTFLSFFTVLAVMVTHNSILYQTIKYILYFEKLYISKKYYKPIHATKEATIILTNLLNPHQFIFKTYPTPILHFRTNPPKKTIYKKQQNFKGNSQEMKPH